MKVYEALTQALVLEGMERFFGLMTNETVHLMTHATKLGVPMIRSRTEGGAVGMADGYARATGDPSVAIVGAGPGSTPTATALATARNRRSPLVLLVGDTKRDAHPRKTLDLASFYRTVAGHYTVVGNVGALADGVHEVFGRARAGEGPAVLVCPQDVLDAGVVGAWQYEPRPVAVAFPEPPAEQLKEVAQILLRAHKPVIVAGRGAVSPDARDALMVCGDSIGALLGTTIQAPDLFRDSAYNLGHVGTLGSAVSAELLAEADCVLAVGSSLDRYMSDSGRLFPRATVVQVDVRADAIGRMTPVDVGLVGEAAATVRRLNEVVDAERDHRAEGFRTAATRRRLAAAAGRADRGYVRAPGCLDPREVADVLDDRLPAGRVVVTDTGHSILFAAERIGSFDHPRDRVWTSDFGAVGAGLAIGIGVAMARPERSTITFVGDGAFLMALHELDTAVRHRVPITVVVLDNGEFGSEVRHLVRMGEPPDLARFDTPDLAAVAAALGCAAVTVTDRDELEAAAERIPSLDGPFVIAAKINADVVHPARG